MTKLIGIVPSAHFSLENQTTPLCGLFLETTHRIVIIPAGGNGIQCCYSFGGGAGNHACMVYR